MTEEPSDDNSGWNQQRERNRDAGCNFQPWTGSESGAAPRWDIRPYQIELLLFESDNPNGWILKGERYFELHCMLNVEKLETAILGLESEELVWFGWENK